MNRGGKAALSILHCNKPVIAALQGSAVGVGITMTLPCTIRIACKSAKIAFPFVRRGLVPEATSSFFLPRLIGYSKALHIFSTGETLPADSKLLEGLFSEILDTPEAVQQRGVEIASEIASKTSAVSGWLVEKMMWRGATSPEEAHLLESSLLQGLFDSRYVLGPCGFDF
jgi:enoyl-CoA hydratase/carnithine racemase